MDSSIEDAALEAPDFGDTVGEPPLVKADDDQLDLHHVEDNIEVNDDDEGADNKAVHNTVLKAPP